MEWILLFLVIFFENCMTVDLVENWEQVFPHVCPLVTMTTKGTGMQFSKNLNITSQILQKHWNLYINVNFFILFFFCHNVIENRMVITGHTHIKTCWKKKKRIYWACSLTFLASCTNWCHWVLNWRLELTWVFHDSYVVLSMVILSVYSDTILSTVFVELLMSMVESSWICRKQNHTLNTTFISDSVNHSINYI